MIYRFDDCELDAGRVVLRRAGETVPIEPQVFELLRCLIERRGQMVSKEELLDTVWGDRFVSESALTSRIKSARRAVGDDGSTQRLIRTVHGRGYEFVGEVTEGAAAPSAVAATRQRVAAPSTLPSTLPASVHALVGRDELLDQLAAEMATTRLLTVVGPGGVGKTSVALELARREHGRHADGVALVELVSVRDRQQALGAVATALDVNTRRGDELLDAIVDLLRPRQVLLVVDNCEHLIEPTALLLEQILRAAPDVSIVATSREPLAISGERVFVVDPLDVRDLDHVDPDVDLDALGRVPAIALFVERARSVDARFALTVDNATAVAEICRRLDGIPLALELAAARTAAIDVTEISRRLDERFRLLKAVRRGADPRHSALADAIGWSYDLLDPGEQQLFGQLAVFAGPFGLDDAEAVCDADDVLDLLTRLTQRSMVTVRRPPSGGTRYEVLETLREFGRGRLDDLANLRLFDVHAHHFADLAVAMEAELRGPHEATGARRIDASFADLRAAQSFAVQVGDADTALALITSLCEYAMRAMRYEVFGWAEAAAPAVADQPHPLRPLLTAMRAYGAWVRGQVDRALELADLAEADEGAAGRQLGLVERVRGNVWHLVGNLRLGDEHCGELVTIAEQWGTPSQLVHANYMASISASSVEDYDTARQRYEVAFEVAKRTGSPTDLASAWVAKGFATRGDDEAALDCFAAGDRIARSAGNRWMSAFACTEASGLRVSKGDLGPGCWGLAETVDVWYRTGEWSQQWLTLARAVIALDRAGLPEHAARVLGAVERHSALDAVPVMPTIRDMALATRESLESRFGADRLAELCTAGAAAPVVELVHDARNALLGRPAGA